MCKISIKLWYFQLSVGFILNYAFRALRAHLQLWTWFFCLHCKTKTNKNFKDFIKNSFVDFQNFLKIEFCYKQIFENSIIHNPSVGSREVPSKNLGPIGSAVLAFLGYKQTDKQTPKQAKYINRRTLRYRVKPTNFRSWSRGILIF